MMVKLPITPESGAIAIESCSIFNHPRIRGRYRSSHLCRRIPVRYLYLWTAEYRERHETPGNAKGNAHTVTASPRFGHLSRFGTSKAGVTSRSRHAASRSVTHGLGSVQALPWSCLVPIHSVLTDDSVKAHGLGTLAARTVHASLHQGGPGTRETGKLSPTDRCPKFSHPQFTGRPWLMTSGGMLNAWRALVFLGRPLNSRSINVQKKGDGFAQKTQQKPTGFLGGFSC